jgi:hypothetical protein
VLRSATPALTGAAKVAADGRPGTAGGIDVQDETSGTGKAPDGRSLGEKVGRRPTDAEYAV